MTIHECRILYPNYAAKEQQLKNDHALDALIALALNEKERPGREVQTRPGLTPDLEKGGDGG